MRSPRWMVLVVATAVVASAAASAEVHRRLPLLPLLPLVLLASAGESFGPVALRARRSPLSRASKPLPPLQQHPSNHHHVIGGTHILRTAMAGRVWPALRKLHVTPAKVRRIGSEIRAIAHWQGVAFLLVVAYATLPVFRLVWERHQLKKGGDSNPTPSRDWAELRRRRVAEFAAGLARVALSVYAVDVLCVALTSLGFAFPSRWDVPSLYSKTAYSYYLVRNFLRFKKIAICKWYRVSPDTMGGKVELLDRFASALTLGLVGLAWLDWVSIKVGLALKGLLAFGSVGTLAFTFASQDLVSQFVSGLLLSASNKVYPGDDVAFGDGTRGTVVKLGWMDTVLRGGDNSLTSVPNAKLANQRVSNWSRVRLSQVSQTLRFHYKDADVLPEVLETIKEEIRRDCPRLVTDGTRPFRVFWTGFKEDHLEVMVDAHFQIPPIGDSYWFNRQKVLMAINRAVKSHGLEFARLYRVEGRPPAIMGLGGSSGGNAPLWRVVEPTFNNSPIPPLPRPGHSIDGAPLREPMTSAPDNKATTTAAASPFSSDEPLENRNIKQKGVPASQ